MNKKVNKSKTTYKRNINKDEDDNDRLWVYKWIVIIGVLIILFFWTTILNSQSGIEYYNIITTNNLFRPLGWKPPNLTPKYELIGTWISVNTNTRVAYVRDTRTNKIRRMGIGDNLNGVVINNIKRNALEMNGGEKYESPTMQFLNFSTVKRSSKRSSTSSRENKINTNQTTKEKEEQTTTSRTTRRSDRTGGANWESQVQRFQNASPEDRQQIIEQFRSMRGNRGGNRDRSRRNRRN